MGIQGALNPYAGRQTSISQGVITPGEVPMPARIPWPVRERQDFFKLVFFNFARALAWRKPGWPNAVFSQTPIQFF